ncbi:MAG: hypothetical protein IJ358_03405 [Clostridia bacterium]|nr:hypothetical protein [Clostridia bacterium]
MQLQNENMDCRFIANKIIIEYNKTKTKNSLGLTISRLGKLVLLVEIAYMQRYRNALIRDNYRNNEQGHGLYIDSILCSYDYWKLMPVKIPQKFSINFQETFYSQQEIEQLIGDKLNSKIDEIINYIVEITNKTDTVDLREMLRLDEYINIPDTMRLASIVTDKVKCVLRRIYVVPKYLIYQAYQDFDFENLEQFNNLQTL